MFCILKQKICLEVVFDAFFNQKHCLISLEYQLQLLKSDYIENSFNIYEYFLKLREFMPHKMSHLRLTFCH